MVRLRVRCMAARHLPVQIHTLFSPKHIALLRKILIPYLLQADTTVDTHERTLHALLRHKHFLAISG